MQKGVVIKKMLGMLVLTFFLFPAFVYGVEIPNPLGEDSTIWTIIGRLINWAFYIALIVGIFAIIYAGYLFLFSAGDPEKVRTARHLIIYAIIGIIVVFLSKGIINLLLSILGSTARIP